MSNDVQENNKGEIINILNNLVKEKNSQVKLETIFILALTIISSAIFGVIALTVPLKIIKTISKIIIAGYIFWGTAQMLTIIPCDVKKSSRIKNIQKEYINDEINEDELLTNLIDYLKSEEQFKNIAKRCDSQIINRDEKKKQLIAYLKDYFDEMSIMQKENKNINATNNPNNIQFEAASKNNEETINYPANYYHNDILEEREKVRRRIR